ncbi:MAG: nitrite reductase small subunit NirD [Nitrincola lacisaponensis]|uniref:nitrite reductase small subunit NirD n=1 Tax=Nitrincola lacisaponensis TaxID=267850 RepID=UPI00391B3C7F
MNAVINLKSSWLPVCRTEDLVAGSGVAVLVETQPVALFWLPDQQPAYYAVSHRDPFSGAEVLAHGLLCESDGQWSVASPLYKQHFSLADGQCLEDPNMRIRCWPVREQAGWIEIDLSGRQTESQVG